MSAVRIMCCVPCGLYEQGTDLAKRIYDDAGENIDSITIEPGPNGTIAVYIDDNQLYNSNDEEFDTETITERIVENI